MLKLVKTISTRSFHIPFNWDIIKLPFSLTLRTYEDHSRSFERLVQVVNKTRLRQLKFIKLHFIRVTKAWFKSFVPLHHSSTAVGAQTDVVVLMLYRTKSFGYVFSLDLNSVATFFIQLPLTSYYVHTYYLCRFF